MEATITTIGDVFKQKVRDTEFAAYDAPTIWIDYYGNKHEDTEFDCIESYDTGFIDDDPKPIPPEGKDQFEIYRECKWDDNSKPIRIGIYGTIIQIGSHVKDCRQLFNPGGRKYTQTPLNSSRLRDLFRYATGLEEANGIFQCAKVSDDNIELPEDLFWDCPNLKVALYTFVGIDKIHKIPERLFAKNPNLAAIPYCFTSCHNITSIPENLFKNNLNLKNISNAFSYTGIKEIPYKLFEPLKDKIENNEIFVKDCFADTPICKRYVEVCKDLGLDPRKMPKKPFKTLKDEGTVPDYFSDKVLSQMIPVFSWSLYK